MDSYAISLRLGGLFVAGFVMRYVAISLYADVEVGIETIGGFGFFIGLLMYGLGFYYIRYHACRSKARSWEMTSEFVSHQEHDLQQMEAELHKKQEKANVQKEKGERADDGKN